MSEDVTVQTELPLGNVGSRLKDAREAAGLSIADIASKTKIPTRMLTLLEAGDYGAMASRAYALGFARTYARTVGLDAAAIVNDMRAELGTTGHTHSSTAGDTFEPGDPSRVPSRKLALLAAAGAFAVIVAGYWFWRPFTVPSMTTPSLVTASEDAPVAEASAATAAPTARPDANSPVVFTSLDDGIWVKFYDKGGVQLLQKQLAKGESYTVPQGASAPMLWTGRPDKLTVTIGGQPVAPISTVDKTVKDVPVSAAALLARPPAPAPVAPTAAATPAETVPGLPDGVPRAVPLAPATP